MPVLSLAVLPVRVFELLDESRKPLGLTLAVFLVRVFELLEERQKPATTLLLAVLLMKVFELLDERSMPQFPLNVPAVLPVRVFLVLLEAMLKPSCVFPLAVLPLRVFEVLPERRKPSWKLETVQFFTASPVLPDKSIPEEPISAVADPVTVRPAQSRVIPLLPKINPGPTQGPISLVRVVEVVRMVPQPIWANTLGGGIRIAKANPTNKKPTSNSNARKFGLTPTTIENGRAI